MLEKCLSERGVPKYRKEIDGVLMCLASEFYVVGDNPAIRKEASYNKLRVNCPHMNNWFYHFSANVYYCGCGNKLK